MAGHKKGGGRRPNTLPNIYVKVRAPHRAPDYKYKHGPYAGKTVSWARSMKASELGVRKLRNGKCLNTNVLPRLVIH